MSAHTYMTYFILVTAVLGHRDEVVSAVVVSFNNNNNLALITVDN